MPKSATKWVGNNIVQWVADANARRVPTFVIARTGLNTKHAILAKYGEGAVFRVDVPVTNPQLPPAPAPGRKARKATVKMGGPLARKLSAKPAKKPRRAVRAVR